MVGEHFNVSVETPEAEASIEEVPMVEGEGSHEPGQEEGSGGDTSRRSVLQTTASAIAGGAFLSAGTVDALAQEDGRLDVETTDVEVLGQAQDDSIQARTTGAVAGMSNYDCERCHVGAQIQPADSHEWYGGLQTIKHAPHDGFRVAVSLSISGLTPGRYYCRLCACPATRKRIQPGTIILIIVNQRQRVKKKKRTKKKRKKKKKKHKKKKKKQRVDKKKLKKAYKKQCPCPIYHPERYHLTVSGGTASSPRRYAFRASSHDIEQVEVSTAPSYVPDHGVTRNYEDYIDGQTVTGAVASGADSYICRGEVTDIRVDNDVSVYIHGTDLSDAVGGY
jgi:hypothetical protein